MRAYSIATAIQPPITCYPMTAVELKQRFPHASQSFIQANVDRLCAAKPERIAQRALERPSPGEAPRIARLEIHFRVYAMRPADWDNYRLKDVQDCLVVAGLLPDDDYATLQGCVSSYKVYSKEEERTEIEAYDLLA